MIGVSPASVPVASMTTELPAVLSGWAFRGKVKKWAGAHSTSVMADFICQPGEAMMSGYLVELRSRYCYEVFLDVINI